MDGTALAKKVGIVLEVKLGTTEGCMFGVLLDNCEGQWVGTNDGEKLFTVLGSEVGGTEGISLAKNVGM